VSTSLLERPIQKRPDRVRLQGRILFLTEDPDLIKKQLAGWDLPWNTKDPSKNPKLRDDISTDEITPAHYCFYFDRTLGEIPYLGLKCGSVYPIGRSDVKNGGFVCSVSGKRQWRTLTEALRDRYRVLAVNLYGYGETTPWPAIEPQSLAAQAQLVLAVCDEAAGPVDLVGHSFGGSVALKSALLLGDRVSSMVLLEPNPFHLLEQAGRSAAWLETGAAYDVTTACRARAAERFADYWPGEGT
jgi:hypothetical protein